MVCPTSEILTKNFKMYVKVDMHEFCRDAHWALGDGFLSESRIIVLPPTLDCLGPKEVEIYNTDYFDFYYYDYYLKLCIRPITGQL